MRKVMELKRSMDIWMKKAARPILSILCVLALAVSNFMGYLPARQVRAESGNVKLSNLIIDKLYKLEAAGENISVEAANSYGFSPDINGYEGTVYSSVDEIKVYPFPESSQAQVTVNGEDLQGDGWVKLDVKEPGIYPVVVNVKDGDKETSYSVSVTKVDTDYRDRKSITNKEEIMSRLSVTTEFGDEDKLLDILKKEHLVILPETKAVGIYVNADETYWETKTPPVNEANGTPTSFTVDLGNVYSISRIRAAVGPSNLGLGKNKVRISVSTDGENWISPVTKGNINTGIQYHQNVIRYEFGVSHEARYIKYEVTHWEKADMNLRLYQFMIYYDAGAVPEEQPAPEGGYIPYQHEEKHQYLASGQASVVERGLPLSGWTPSSGYGRGTPTREEAEQFGYDGPLFYDPDFENPDYMLYNPEARWGIAKAPFGGNNMGGAGEPRDFVPDSMKPYINNAVSFCFGDEGGYNTSEGMAYAEWFQWTREHYPGVILHTNQFPALWSEAQLLEYFRLAQPDMITWDDYYADGSQLQPSSINLSVSSTQKDAARRLVNLNNWDMYRRLAFGGIDGSGSQPILFGQYLDSCVFNQPTSVKNMVTNLSILSGAKWLNFFRVEFQFDRSYLWDEDGTPTRGLMDWKGIIDRIHAIDPQLTRLNNEWIMFKTGSIGDSTINAAKPDGFRRGDFDSEQSRSKNEEFGLTAVTAESLSTVHNGGTGDVILGYYNTLPGLYESEIKEYFQGATAPRAFMVMNGLIGGASERLAAPNIVNREKGASENTMQRITITTSPAFADKTLYLVDKDHRNANGDAKVKTVPRAADGSFTITLGGGESNLYFWGTDTTAAASSQAEGAYASFAFDAHPLTYWQPAQISGDGKYTIENTFAERNINQITITQKGDAVKAFSVEYKAADGSWKPFGEKEEAMGDIALVTQEAAAAVSGIRLNVEQSLGLPGIFDIETENTLDSENQEKTIIINDNVMGEGINRFNYDGSWSYREAESGSSSIFPLESDGHFSNFADSTATLQFYGSKVELLLRSDQASQIKAQVFDQTGSTAVSEEKTGSGRSLIFEGLEQKGYILKISKKTAGQAGIDGANVTCSGPIPEGANEGTKAVQVYLNQKISDGTKTDYFTYDPAPVVKEIPGIPGGTNVEENDGWVEYSQDIIGNNIGFSRTNHINDSFTLHFYGTGVQLYTASVPVNGNNGLTYGNMKFELDGQQVMAEYDRVYNKETKWGTNGNISLRQAEIAVPGAIQNGEHTLKVTVENGYNRIDYAVVNRFWEENLQSRYLINLECGENGAAVANPSQVMKRGNTVITISPDEGYQVNKIIVNSRVVPAPENGRLILKDIQSDTKVTISFREALYKVQAVAAEGGSTASDRIYAKEGDTVTLTIYPLAGRRLAENGIKVTDSKETPVVLTTLEDGRFTFVQPAGDVKVTAVFEEIPFVIDIKEGITGGSLTVEPAETAAFRQRVTIKAEPQEGNRLVSGSLKVTTADGSTIALDPTQNPGEYTFVMPLQAVQISALFEIIPDYSIMVEEDSNGTVETKSEVMAGEDLQLVFCPKEGYKLGAFYVNGEIWYVPEGNTMTLKNIGSDLVLKPVFVEAQTLMYTGNVESYDTSMGSVEPAVQNILDNGTAVYFVIALPGYYIKSIQSGITRQMIESVSDNDSLTDISGSDQKAAFMQSITENAVELTIEYEAASEQYESRAVRIPQVTGELTLHVEFARKAHQITVEETANGKVTVNALEAAPGETITIRVTADEGYRLKEESLKVLTAGNEMQNLTAVKEGETYTFLMPDENVAVKAVFEAKPENPQPPVENPDPIPPVDTPEPVPPNGTDDNKPAGGESNSDKNQTDKPGEAAAYKKSPKTDTVEIDRYPVTGSLTGQESITSPEEKNTQDNTAQEQKKASAAIADGGKFSKGIAAIAAAVVCIAAVVFAYRSYRKKNKI